MDSETSPAPAVRARRKPRHDQWTQARMALFLRELAATQSVAAAARHVGMSRQSACRLRDRLVNTPFSPGWDVALEAAPGFTQRNPAFIPCPAATMNWVGHGRESWHRELAEVVWLAAGAAAGGERGCQSEYPG